MHEQHQKGIHPTIPKDPIDDHKTYTVREKNNKVNKHYHFLLSLLPLQRNPTPTFGHCRSPQFAFCHCKSIHYP